jgi:L-alanine-DL-glutamate epimerase-like enolase superfamily enzyme
LSEAHNLPLTSHGAHDVTVQLLSAAPNRSYLEVHGFPLDRYVAEKLRIVDGCAIAPERPGHGVDIDWKALEKHRIGGA